jgi:hypothetical protein
MALCFERAFAVGFLQSRLVCFFVVGFSGLLVLSLYNLISLMLLFTAKRSAKSCFKTKLLPALLKGCIPAKGVSGYPEKMERSFQRPLHFCGSAAHFIIHSNAWPAVLKGLSHPAFAKPFGLFFCGGVSGFPEEWRFVLKGPLQSAFCKAAWFVFLWWGFRVCLFYHCITLFR